jgi:ABC-type polysaccharide/polyol phosphate transport system ATPase subunit
MMEPGSIVAENVSRRFKVYPQRNVTLKEAIIRRRHLRPVDVWAVKDVSLEIEPGEAVGFMGRNGSGKTTLLRLFAGVFRPTSGRLDVTGRVGSLLELGAGFHPDFTGRENIYLSASIYGLRRKEVNRRLDEIISFSELHNFIDLPIRTYSSGMYMRLGFSIAVNVDADILLLDEVFAVGDEAFQRKCVERILDFKRRGNTIAFVSHSGASIEHLCDRAVLLREGSVEYDGATSKAIRRYQELLASEENPAEREVGLTEWGTSEARMAGISLEDVEGGRRDHFVSGEPLVLRLWVVPRDEVPPPRVTLEFRDGGGALLGTARHDLEDFGLLRFELPRLPLVDGRVYVSVDVTAQDGRRYHRIESAVEFAVVPEADDRGWFRFEGDWTLEHAAREIPETEGAEAL